MSLCRVRNSTLQRSFLIVLKILEFYRLRCFLMVRSWYWLQHSRFCIAEDTNSRNPNGGKFTSLSESNWDLFP